ncbi:MAG: inorganic diphosphatase, partial [Candidatus Andersenbacteria bacterium]|nr:inorganic diphosphatase [Candidatus Andersenbacteria bacterium]
CVHRVRVIGMLETADEAGVDPKILAVPIEKVDPRWAEVKTWEDLPEHVRKEIHLHFKEIKKLEGEKYPKVEIGDFKGVDEATDVIQKAIEAYNEEHKK